MKTVSVLVLVFITATSLFAEGLKHEEELAFKNARDTNELKRNDAYLKLCGNSPKQNGPVKATQLDAKALAAYDLLRAKCATCHNQGSTTGAKSFSDILSVEELLSKGLIKAGDSKTSTLIERVEDGSMPLGQAELSEEEKKILKDWIESGAKTFSSNATGIPEVGFISNDDLEACMVKDLRNVKEEDKPFIRYLNLGNLYNSGRRSEIERTRLALNKLLNSLSWKKGIKNPVVIDGTSTLLRLDLRDYKWTPEMWEEIAKANPYPEPIDNTRDRELAEKTKTGTPHLRGDWVVFSASRPPLYHSLLYDLQTLPEAVGKVNAVKSLEKLLHVDSQQDERLGDVVKAGFRQSNVTKSNRIITVHETPYGDYWKSDDFKTRVGEQNIFEHPLDSKPDGGEFIYSLPNELHAYLVADKNGTRLDGAPTDVVVDPLRFHKDGVVLPGVSCMSCHTSGIKKHNDEILTHFEDLERIFKDKTDNPQILRLVEDVKKVYKGNVALNQRYNEGEKAYVEALLKTGNSASNPDPVHATSDQFEAPLDIRSMAAELGHTTEEVEEVINSNFELRQRLAFGNQHTIDRETFNANFGLLRRALGNEDFGGRFPVGITADPNIDAHFEFASVRPGTFKMGSPANEAGRDSDETQHTVTITKPFEIQTTEVTQSLWEKVMGSNPSQFKGANRPVEQVSWNDAQEFIKRLNGRPEIKRSGFKYRLPTEAEWEYAARGGNEPGVNMETAYSFGNDANQLGSFGWFTGNSDNQTHDVADASKKPNPLKLHDMNGNVWEWVEDAFQAELGTNSVTDPRIDSGSLRVFRGGGWVSDAQFLRSAGRVRFSADVRNNDLGFRLVRTPQ